MVIQVLELHLRKRFSRLIRVSSFLAHVVQSCSMLQSSAWFTAIATVALHSPLIQFCACCSDKLYYAVVA